MHSVFSLPVFAFWFAPRFRNLRASSRRWIQRKKWAALIVGFKAGSLAGAQLTIQWNDNSSRELGFKVERSTNGTTFSPIAAVGANTTSYQDNSVTAGATYWYRVKAYDLLSASSYSNVTSAKAPSTTTSTGGTGSTGSTTTGPVLPRIQAFTARTFTGKSTPNPLVMSFTVAGSSKSVFLRGVGPGLGAFTNSVLLPDPTLYLHAGTTQVGFNDNWGGTTALKSVATRVGAYALSSTSKDSALNLTLAAKTYVQTINGNYSGLAQTELYDADTASNPAGRFSVIQARGAVGTGDSILAGGFVVVGDTSIKLVIRAIGPSLTGLTSPLKDPQLSLYKDGTLMIRNDNWGGGTTLQSAFTRVGASALTTTSKDSAMLVTLQPGVYSVTISGVASTVGVARLEIYEYR